MSTSRSRWIPVRLALLGALVAAAPIRAADTVVQEIVLIRHGIRSPTKPPSALDKYSRQTWHAWPVQPGTLTEHGAAMLKSQGAWYRRRFAADGLALAACGTTPSLRVIADSTERNRASAAAMMDALLPGCPQSYDAFAPAQDDPLFRGGGSSGDSDDDDRDSAKGAPRIPIPALHKLQQVLLGCSGKACWRRARADGITTVRVGENPAKAIKTAGSLAENLMLEYVQGLPLTQVGWGRLDAASVEQITTLHNASFAWSKRALDAARGRGGNLLAHVAATFAARAHEPPATSATSLGTANTLLLIGHDTGLASQAGLLDLDWHNASQPDDYPPGGALIYQLVKTDRGNVVRITAAMPTLASLRSGHVDDAQAVHVARVRIGQCGAQYDCPLPRFLALVTARVPADLIGPAGNEPPVH